MYRNIFKILLVFLIIISSMTALFSKQKIRDERRFQLGFGFIIGTHSLAGLSETTRIYNALKDNEDYYFPLAVNNKDYFDTLNNDQKTGILVGHILGGWEYGFQFRILWNIIIAETDIILSPFDASRNGRFDFIIMPMIGIKAPLALMPYIMFGLIYTFSFYPGEYSFTENNKSSFTSNINFSYRPGLVIKAGVEFKIPKYLKIAKFSVGGYIQYTIKDFEEFNYIYFNYKESGYSDFSAVLKILENQLRFGISLCYYLF